MSNKIFKLYCNSQQMCLDLREGETFRYVFSSPDELHSDAEVEFVVSENPAGRNCEVRIDFENLRIDFSPVFPLKPRPKVKSGVLSFAEQLTEDALFSLKYADGVKMTFPLKSGTGQFRFPVPERDIDDFPVKFNLKSRHYRYAITLTAEAGGETEGEWLMSVSRQASSRGKMGNVIPFLMKHKKAVLSAMAVLVILVAAVWTVDKCVLEPRRTVKMLTDEFNSHIEALDKDTVYYKETKEGALFVVTNWDDVFSKIRSASYHLDQAYRCLASHPDSNKLRSLAFEKKAALSGEYCRYVKLQVDRYYELMTKLVSDDGYKLAFSDAKKISEWMDKASGISFTDTLSGHFRFVKSHCGLFVEASEIFIQYEGYPYPFLEKSEMHKILEIRNKAQGSELRVFRMSLEGERRYHYDSRHKIGKSFYNLIDYYYRK